MVYADKPTMIDQLETNIFRYKADSAGKNAAHFYQKRARKSVQTLNYIKFANFTNFSVFI